MSWDAGSIIAHLDLEDRDFQRKLDADVRRIEAFERRDHEIKLTPHVDETGANQARRSIQQLDQRITTDAHRRGGVLSMLTRMFSSTGTGGSGGGSGAANFHRNILSAMGPSLNNLSPLGVKGSLIAAAAPLALGALPALAAPLAVGGVGLAGVGVAGALGMAAAKPALGLAQARTQAQAALASAATPAQAQAAQAKLAQINQQVSQLSPALHSIFTSITGIQTWWQKLTKSLAPMIAGPLHQIAGMIETLGPGIKQMFGGAMTLIVPFTRGLFYIANAVMPLLNQAFRAAAPSIEPLLVGVGHLLTGLLPGLISLLRAAHPAITVFAQILGTLGRDIGGMLRDFAPVLRSSSVILKALLDVVSALFPIIGRLAQIFARALAPVFVQLAAVVKSLLPFLVTLGKILAGFASAVIGDLVAVLKAVAILIKDLAPSFAVLAKAAGQVFRILENSGVFGVLANALLQLAPALANLVNALVVGIAPILPTIIQLFAQLLTILAGGLGATLTVVANAFAALINALPPKVLQAIVVGLLAWAAAVKTMEVVKGLVGMYKSARQAIVLFTYTSKYSALQSAAAWVKSTAETVAQWTVQAARAVWSATTTAAAWVAKTATVIASNVAEAISWTALWVAENLATLGIIAGITLLVAAVIYLATHWHQVWGEVKRIAKDVWDFLTHGWGQYLIPGLYLIRKAVEFVRGHWKQAWDDIKGTGVAAWHFIHDDIVSPLVNAFTKTLPNAFRTGVSIIKTAWHAVQDAVRVPAAWVVDHVVNGLINAYDWVAKAVHAPQIQKNYHPFGLQTGGRIPGYGGGDRHMALLEGGEAVVSKETTASHAADLQSWGVPGFQHGGRVGQAAPGTAGRAGQAAAQGRELARGQGADPIAGVLHKAADLGKIMAAMGTGNVTALGNALSDMFGHGAGGALGDYAKMLVNIPAQLITAAAKNLMGYGGGGLGGRGADVARYAMSFAGRIPYIWGGTAVPGGADCSGFVQSVYRHFGISAPRTSEAQGAWVKRGSPQIGGLALYNSPAGGPPPGHVAIVGFKGNVISQGGGMGPQIQPLRSMPLMFTGVPPGGGLGNVGPGDLAGLERLWTGAGGPASAAHVAGAIGMAESGGRSVKQAGQPPGLTGWGVWQITPTSGIGQNGRFGNLLNTANNARAAVFLYRQAGGFSPWATYNDGAYRSFMDSGGWLRPGANMIMNGTGRGEAVLNPPQTEAFLALAEAARKGSQPAFGGSTLEAKLDRLIRAVERGAVVTGGAVADALNGVTRQASYRSAYNTRGL